MKGEVNTTSIKIELESKLQEFSISNDFTISNGNYILAEILNDSKITWSQSSNEFKFKLIDEDGKKRITKE